MNFGERAHVIFKKHLRKKTLWDKLVPETFLFSIGGISYFLNGEGYETRVYIQNYFSLLTDSVDAGARWSVDIYSDNGEKVGHKDGVLKGYQGAVVEISQFPNAGHSGIIWVKIQFTNDEYAAAKPFGSIFFTEFSLATKKGKRKIISHSLGYPSASIYTYDRTSTGIVLPLLSRPYLLFANGSLLKPCDEITSASGILEVINHKHSALEILLPKIMQSLGSMKVDLFKECPALEAHISDQPFSMRIKGRNMLGKPFLFMAGEGTLLGDHT